MLPAEGRDLRHARGSLPGFACTTPCSSSRNNSDRSPAKKKTPIAPGAGPCASRACKPSTPRSEPLTDPLTGDQITEIEWMTEDALPFPFCLSGFTDEEHGAQFRDDLSIVHGNIVLADHGLTIAGESLGEVPASQILLPPAAGADRCDLPPPQFAPVRFRPTLSASPLTHASPYDATLPASTSLLVDRRRRIAGDLVAERARARHRDLASAARLVRQRARCDRVRGRDRKRRGRHAPFRRRRIRPASRNPGPLSKRPIGSATAARATSARKRSPTS